MVSTPQNGSRHVTVSGAPEGFDATLVLSELEKAGRPVVHVARDDKRMAAMRQALEFFAPGMPVFTFPGWDCLPYDRVSPNADISAMRMATAISTAARPARGMCAASGAARADAVTDWNANAGAAALAACIAPADNPLHESRLYAMLHLAVHDALNAIERRSRPFAYDASAAAGTSVEAAVAAAAHDVLVSQIALIGAPFPPQCISAGIARAEADYASTLGAIADGAAK